MRKSSHLTLALLLATAGMAHAQNSGARPTPQTQNSQPAAIRDAANGGAATTPPAGATPNAPMGSTAARGATPQNASQGGATASPTGGTPSRGGASGPAKSNAPAATARVVVTGDADGNGIPDRDPNSGALPGVSLLHNALGVSVGAPILVRLQQSVDSGHAKNGDTIRGSLAAPLGKFPAGAPVQLTVVAAAPAGQLNSRGELSLQVISVNGEQFLSDVITAEGKEGAKILPDDAPTPGTEAIFTPDQTISLPAA